LRIVFFAFATDINIPLFNNNLKLSKHGLAKFPCSPLT